MAKSTVEQSLKYIFLFVVILMSCVFFVLSFYSFDNKDDREIIGNLFFIGDMEGFLSGQINCEGAENSLSKLAGILKYYKKYSFFDLGDFSELNESRMNNSIKIIDVYKRLGISAINLTKKDLIRITRADYFPQDILFFSSNIDCDISKLKYYENRFNIAGLRYKRLIILGVSDNRRIYHKNEINYKISDASIVLNEIMKTLNYEEDFIILLFHDSIKNLKYLLNKINYNNIKCVVGCYGMNEYHANLGNLPIIYISARGKTIGQLILVRRKTDVILNIIKIRSDERYPEDPSTKRYIEIIKNDHSCKIL